MRGFNRVIIAGNLARDPDVRYSLNKRAYARLSVAVSSRRKDSSGEYKDFVDYFPVVAWGITAENCGKYLKKGSGVLVEGRLQTGSYEAKDGSGKRYTTDIIADNLQFIGGSGQSSGNANNNSRPQANDTDFMPTEDDFGKSIGEGGFGGGFGNASNNIPDDMSESDIPF